MTGKIFRLAEASFQIEHKFFLVPITSKEALRSNPIEIS